MAQSKNRVRIIGGRWRGRKITFPDVDGLRPTTDPIRETLFNWLQPHLPQANCLDLFAGSGALGFEAASRGAKHVLMVEKENHIVKFLRDNKELMQADNVQLMQRTAMDFLNNERKADEMTFDVIFLDPPFETDSLRQCVEQLEESGCLADDAVIYIECERKLDLTFIPTHWFEHRRKTTGQVAYYLFHRESQ